MQFLSTYFNSFSRVVLIVLTLSLLAFVLGYSLVYALGIALFLIGSYASVTFPRAVLFGLIVLRMSLDYSSQYLAIPITYNVTLSLSQLIGILVFALGCLFLLVHGNKLKGISLIGAIVLLLGFGLVNLTYSISPNETAKELLRIADIALLFCMGYSAIKTQKHYEMLLEAIMVSSLAPIALGIYQYANGIGFADETVQIPRIYGTFSHPNVLSLYLFIVIAFTSLYYFLFAKSQSKKIAVLALIAFYAVLLLLTYTRIAWIALFTFLFIVIWFSNRKFLLPLVLIPLGLYLLVLPVQERINQALYSSPTDSISWRQTLWQDNIRQTIIHDKWLFGYGINTFPLVSENLRGQALGSNDAHDDFVKFFVEGGVVGLGIFCLYLLAIFTLLARHLRKAKNGQERYVYLYLFAIFIGMLLASFTDNVFKNTPLQWLFWTMLGASLANFPKEKRAQIFSTYAP